MGQRWRPGAAGSARGLNPKVSDRARESAPYELPRCPGEGVGAGPPAKVSACRLQGGRGDRCQAVAALAGLDHGRSSAVGGQHSSTAHPSYRPPIVCLARVA